MSENKSVESRDELRFLGQVRRGNVFEETLGQLLRGMRLGVFPPGSKLPAERELAEALGVSRATLRDSLAELQSAGYLEVQRGRYGGTIVAGFPRTNENPLDGSDRSKIEDVLLFRSVVEPAAAELAAKAVLTSEQRVSLMEAHHAVDTADVNIYRPLDARLHVMIADLSGSGMLAKAVAEARNATSELLDRIPFLHPNIKHSSQQHEAIIHAILRGDAASAKQLMEEHLEGTATLLRGFLD
ncbi:hypothetical protein AOZ07_15945 [Glutamicibacter halophytocola]|uniref:FadR/GntR family transcriptional regulator n=1 Tax=Glutamicibacter halophytocola TaxID=1933880 RepID=UPI0006D49A4F|nr:FCD domain-containing protein [Glutamicibacter halophytocola]ALG30327.1 hypothetical protein AOZ07_15945 [Glutamicibacter halophytocola]